MTTEPGSGSRAPIEDERVIRIIDREVQEEVARDAFGDEVTKRLIKQRIVEIEAKHVGAVEDLASLPDDTFVEEFLDGQYQHRLEL